MRRGSACTLGAPTSTCLTGAPTPPTPHALQVQHLLSRSATLDQAGGRHRMALRGHRSAVRKVVITAEGRDVLTASDDGTVQVGARRQGRVRVCGLRIGVRKVAIVPQWCDVLTASDDGTVQVGACVWGWLMPFDGNCLPWHSEVILLLPLLPSFPCASLIIAPLKTPRQVWDMDIGDCVMTLQMPGAQRAAAPLTALVVTPGGEACLAGDERGALAVWDLRSGSLLAAVQAHEGRWVGALR